MIADRTVAFVRDRDAGVTVEFVTLMPAFLLLTLFVFEIFLAVLWIGTVEKAAQLGARLAIVSNKAVDNLPTDYPLRSTAYAYGQPCSAGACGTNGTGFASRICTGGSGGDCNNTNFLTIVNRMRAMASIIQPSQVTIRYDYVGLGFAGGPIVPSVQVRIQGVPYGSVTTTLLARFMRYVTRNPNATSFLTNLPPITATFTGEDLSSAGAS